MEKVETYPLVTVVIPAYNRASLLSKAISSVLAQSYPHLELIIADDGSTDDSFNQVKAFNDPRIRWLSLPHSGHIGKVRNAGAAWARGRWLAFLDSDDTWLPGKLECQLEVLRNTARRWCYTNYELMNLDGETVPPKAGSFYPHSGWITATILTDQATVFIGTLLMERSLFEEAGGFSEDERLAFRGDFEFSLRLSLRAEVTAIPTCWARVLEHPGRSTHALINAAERSAMPFTLFLEYTKERAFRRIAKKRRAGLLAHAAVNYARNGKPLKAYRMLWSAFPGDRWRHWLSAAFKTTKAVLTAALKSKSQTRNPAGLESELQLLKHSHR